MKVYLYVAALIALLAAFASTFFVGRNSGIDSERSKWLGRVNEELLAANTKIHSLEEAIRAAELEAQLRVNEASVNLENANAEADLKKDKTISDLHNRVVRLRVQLDEQASTTTSQTSGRDEDKLTSASSERETISKTGFLGEADATFLVSEAERADTIVRERNTLLTIAETYIRICAGKSSSLGGTQDSR